MGGVALYHGDYTPGRDRPDGRRVRDQTGILLNQAAGFVRRTPASRPPLPRLRGLPADQVPAHPRPHPGLRRRRPHRRWRHLHPRAARGAAPPPRPAAVPHVARQDREARRPGRRDQHGGGAGRRVRERQGRRAEARPRSAAAARTPSRGRASSCCTSTRSPRRRSARPQARQAGQPVQRRHHRRAQAQARQPDDARVALVAVRVRHPDPQRAVGDHRRRVGAPEEDEDPRHRGPCSPVSTSAGSGTPPRSSRSGCRSPSGACSASRR
jgi:hypothetical protein